MKVGTDGLLLGAWTTAENAGTILDIGTGTGLLSLMLAQKSEAFIHAIEIDESAALQAKENIYLSPWKDRINVIHISLKEFYQCGKHFDLIICNPPFFSNSLKSPGIERTLARHSDSLSLNDILETSNVLLNDQGKLSLILPYEEGNIFIALAAGKKLFCTRKTSVIPVAGRPVKRLLLEFSRIRTPLAEDTLVISTGTRHHYTEKFKAITRDFYLYFRDEIE
jgi:tRNA1Val (adenine37-N6)-methyltransferase